MDLIITVTLLVTLAGIGGFYYEEFRDSQRQSIASNELDAFAKSIQAYELTTSSALTDGLIQSYRARGLPPLQFLVDVGNLTVVNVDPWGRDYQIDTGRGIVFSKGPEGSAQDPNGADDIRVPYKKEVAGGSAVDFLSPVSGLDDREPPIIDSFSPVGTVRQESPQIRCTFFDNVGGCILVRNASENGQQVVEADRRPKMFIDGVDVDGIGGGLLNRSSNQMIFTSPGGFTETQHIVVAQVEDCSGNITRKQWKFTVDVSPLDVEFRQPQEQQVRGTIPITARIYNNGNKVKEWILSWNFREIGRDTTFSSSTADEVTLKSAFDTKQELDGTHTMTLRVTKETGQVEEFRKAISVDNTPPEIIEIKNKTIPLGSQPQVITTGIPDLGGAAHDNTQVKRVTYQYFTIDSQSRVVTGAVMSSPATALPVDWSPDTEGLNHRLDDPAALYNSADETFYTVPHGSAEEFEPVSMPQGFYRVEFQATDLAGNESAKKTTDFIIDFQSSGIRDAAFLDGTSSICGLSITEDMKHIRGENAVSFIPSFETSGLIQFSLLEEGKTPISTWQVIIDDNGPNGVPDGVFSLSAPADWVSSGSFLGLSAGTTIRTTVFVPDSVADKARRQGITSSPVAVQPGLLPVQISYQSDTGNRATTITDLLIDTVLPNEVGLSGVVVKQSGTVIPIREDDVLFSLTNAQDTGALEFGGVLADRPEEGVIKQVTWTLQRLQPFLEDLVVRDGAFPYPGSPCTTNTASFGTAAGLGTMSVSTSVAGGLDGAYQIQYSVADGAGLTTNIIRKFAIDTVPPEVSSIKLLDPAESFATVLKEIPCAVAPSTITTLEGESLKFTVTVQDQFPIREVHYWLVPITDPPTVRGGPVVIPILSNTLNPVIPDQVITRDTKNQAIKPLPQQYQLQVEAVGQNRSDPGPLCITQVSFRFLSNLAVFAPIDASSTRVRALTASELSTAATWISSTEQRDVADYLLSAFQTGTSLVFDFSGRDGRGSNIMPIQDWLSQNATSGSSDVIVFLDSIPSEALDAGGGTTPPLKLFLEGDGNSSDGNVAVWIGSEPFVRAIRSSLSGESGSFVITTGTAAATQAAIFGADLDIRLFDSSVSASASATQIHEPAGRPLALLPSLYEYSPFSSFIGFGTGVTPDKWLRSGRHSIGSGAGDWVLEQLFTSQLGGPATAIGNCFVYRNTKSNGRFASFYGFGRGTSGTNRNPVAPLPFVVEEFLKNFLTGNRDPLIATKRIAFNNSDTGLAPIGPVATSVPDDVILYPSGSAGFTNLTSNSSGATDSTVVAISDDARSVTFLSKDRSRDGGDNFVAPDTSLFAIEDGTTRLLAKATAAGVPILTASRARRGGVAALATRSNLAGAAAGDAIDKTAIFRVDGFSGNISQITTGGSSAGDSLDPAVSPDGVAVVFTSTNIYDTDDGAVPSAFSSLRALSSGGRGVFLHRADLGGAQVYQKGWVSKTLGEPPTCRFPRVSEAGRFVAFQASQVTYRGVLSSTNQVYLAIRQTLGATPWSIGAITQDSSIPATNPDVSETSGAGGFPLVVFESAGDYGRRKPNSVSLTDPASSVGATASGNLGFKAIYLFTGDFGADLIQIARGTDADCLNPRLSPDGSEVVFESKATTLTAPVAVTSPILEHSITNSSQKNRIYRARIRIDPAVLGNLPRSSIMERITPDGVDVGSPSLPVVAR